MTASPSPGAGGGLGAVAGAGGGLGGVLAGLGRGVAAEAVVLHAQVDQDFHRARVQVACDDRDEHRVARHPAGSVALEPGAAVAGADGGGGPLAGPPGPVVGDPRLLELGVGV